MIWDVTDGGNIVEATPKLWASPMNYRDSIGLHPVRETRRIEGISLAGNANNVYNACMTQLTIRNVDDAVALKLRTRAAAKGRSLEAELRDIITRAASEAPPPRHIGRSIVERFQRHGGVELDLPSRTRERELPDFGE